MYFLGTLVALEATYIFLLTRILANWECELRWSCRWSEVSSATSKLNGAQSVSSQRHSLGPVKSLSPTYVPWQRTSLNCHQDRAWTYQRWPDGAVTRCSLCGFWYPRMLEPCFPVVAELSGEEQRLFVIAVFNIIEVVLYRDNSIFSKNLFLFQLYKGSETFSIYQIYFKQKSFFWILVG